MLTDPWCDDRMGGGVVVDFYIFFIHFLCVRSCLRKILKIQQKPAFYCKNPRANRMNAYVGTAILYVLWKMILSTYRSLV